MEKISWIAPEYLHTEKTSDWYWIVGIVTVSVAVISVILNNIIFAVLVLVSGFMLTLYASRPPRHIKITLQNTGITVDDTFHPYTTLESFWVETREDHPRVILKSTRKLIPHFVLLLTKVDPEEVQETLLHHLPEVEQTEPFFEKLFFYLGF